MALSLCSVMTIFAGKTAYLFSYFINDSKDGLHLAYSYDGLNWMPLNGGQSYLIPSVGKDKLMRDPSICQAPDGTFHMVWTSSWTDRIIGHASSRDLIHWSEQQAIPVMMHEPTAHNCWAPKLFYDEPSQTYYIFWATTIPGRHKEIPTSESEKGLNHRIYYVTTKDFCTFSKTKMFFNPDFSVIDAAIVKDPKLGDRKSFFAVAESNSPVDGFRFWDYPIEMPETDIPDTNMYDMRLTAHEDGWIYGIFCAERKDTNAPAGDLSSAVAVAGIARTKDLKTWQRLPDLKSPSQQRNVVLHPEFVNGKYALYTRPQDGFIDAGNGGGIGWALIDDICHAEIKEEKIINKRFYHTIKEVKNGEGPHPIKTPQGWLHLAHGVRGCAAGLRYVLYLYMTSLEDPTEIIAEPAGYFMAPIGEERIGDVSNVLFSNGWIEDDNGKIYIYYASSDTRLHVAESTVSQLVDYCLHTPTDGFRSIESVKRIITMVNHNKQYLKQ